MGDLVFYYLRKGNKDLSITNVPKISKRILLKKALKKYYIKKLTTLSNRQNQVNNVLYNMK